ncbi:hypothetical protein Spb1_14710 [Planctopirus ephydatiae]|uniref:Uncharacterized protein n=1 Tax=Planctopirus ephydatiae TaxID=2528019 RepID=A0A518GLR9_9PLAN|nr:hypothetical protein Spb1_14710 [Planctopirus ephydatiae]
MRIFRLLPLAQRYPHQTVLPERQKSGCFESDLNCEHVPQCLFIQSHEENTGNLVT